MNEIKKCSISGIAFIFEKVAYNRLKEYIDSLKKAYAQSADCQEIIADIEARIAELILSAQSDPQQTICLPLIENIITQLGSAEDISDTEQKSDAEPQTKTRIARRLYRDMSNAKLGGVCAGLGKYFDTDPVWIRLALFSPLILIPISNISYRYLHWLDDVGGNLFGILIVLYLIMWFVVPQAKSARQKLEMEGETVTAQTIASRQQQSTDEEQAKSAVANVVSWLGRIAIVLIKLFVALMLFPLIIACMGLIFALFAGITGIGASLIDVGNLGSLSQTISTFGAGLPLFTIAIALVPIGVILYLFITLLIGRRPKWWVIICSLIIWILLICGIVVSAHDTVLNIGEDEIERVLKRDWDDVDLSEPIDSVQFNKLLNDPNALSID